MNRKDEETHRIVANCLLRNYGIEGELSRLAGENLNFRIDTSKGSKFVVKVVDDDMPPEVVAMESRVIEHAVSAGFGPKLPGIIKNNNEKLETRINIPSYDFNRLRLIQYIEGIDLDSLTDISNKMLESVGLVMGQFDNLMKNFDHPVAHRTHRWDLTAAGQHRKSISLIEDRNRAELLNWAFDEWEQRASVYFDELPTQFIHGDINRGNMISTGEEITGLVDFGDACFNPTVCELAICLAYIMMDQPDPKASAQVVIDAYETVRPLSDLERQVLFPLACGRLAVTISVANERRQIDSQNQGWLADEEAAWSLLEYLSP